MSDTLTPAMALSQFKQLCENEGYDIGGINGDITIAKNSARIAYDKAYVTFNMADFTMFRKGWEARNV